MPPRKRREPAKKKADESLDLVVNKIPRGEDDKDKSKKEQEQAEMEEEEEEVVVVAEVAEEEEEVDEEVVVAVAVPAPDMTLQFSQMMQLIASQNEQIQMLVNCKKEQEQEKEAAAVMEVECEAPPPAADRGEMPVADRVLDWPPASNASAGGALVRTPAPAPIPAAVVVSDPLPVDSSRREATQQRFENVYATDRGESLSENILNRDASGGVMSSIPSSGTRVGMATRELMLNPTLQQRSIGNLQ